MPTRARAARFFIATLLALASCVLAACSSVQTVGQESNAQLATTYDPQNNRLTLTDSAGDLTRYTYDHANRLTSVAAPAIGTTEYHYNTASQLIERTGQGGYTSVTAYDPAGRVQRIEHRIGGTPTLTLEYDYDRNGNRAEQRLTHAGSGLERTSYAYDNADRLTRNTRTPPTGNALETTWTLDAVGNRTLEEVRELGSLTQRTAYSYDLRDRLQTATPELPTGPPTAYQYDADGNVSSEQIGSAAPTQYRWDARDRLSEYTPAGAPAIRNRYDESDRRIAREDAATGSRYRWDGNAVIKETNALGNRLTRYHRGIGLIGATSATTQPDPRLYASDAQDTPLALIRPDGGIAGRASFDIWGKTTSQSGEQSKLGFTGYQKETGDLYQAVARYYRPGTGSFLSTDPWEGDYNNPVSLNKYLYGYGNPGIFVDPDGRAAAPQCATSPQGCVTSEQLQRNRMLSERESRMVAGLDLDLPKVAEPTGPWVSAPSTAEPKNAFEANARLSRQMEFDAWENSRAVDERIGNVLALGCPWCTEKNELGIEQKVNPLNGGWLSVDDWVAAYLDLGSAIAGGLEGGLLKAPRSGVREITEDAGESGVVAVERNRPGNLLENCCVRCFGAGTLVQTEAGLRPIDEIRVGERVAARNEATNRTELQEVKEVHVLLGRLVRDLSFADVATGRIEVVVVTDDHRFHSADRGWVAAEDLELGEVIGSLDGRKLTLIARAEKARNATTYNLSVSESPNYFVGLSGLWVHNCGPCRPASSATQYARYKQELTRQEVENPLESMSGPVVLRRPVNGATPEQVSQIREYGELLNLAEREGYLSSTGRVSTAGQARREASRSAARERARARTSGQSYGSQVAGHAPDTTWTNMPDPPFWMREDASINSSLGRQSLDYPVGYRPTRFIFEDDLLDDWQ